MLFSSAWPGLILVLSWIVPYIYDLFDTVQTLFSF